MELSVRRCRKAGSIEPGMSRKQNISPRLSDPFSQFFLAALLAALLYQLGHFLSLVDDFSTERKPTVHGEDVQSNPLYFREFA